MGRNRSFVEAEVLARAAEAFRTHGYEGAGIDTLLTATGLHRGSLYQAFGSKRGLFLAVLRAALDPDPLGADGLDVVLVATLELAPKDPEIRALVAERLSHEARPAAVLGARLLARAGIRTAHDTEGVRT